MSTRSIQVLQLFSRLDRAAGGYVAYLRAQEQALRGTPVHLQSCVVTTSLLSRQHSPFAAWTFRQRLASAIRAADVVHIHSILGWHAPLGMWACRKTGTPYVVSSHGAFYPQALATSPIKKKIFLSALGRSILRQSSAVVVTTPAEAETIRVLDGQLDARIVPPGVDMPEGRRARFHDQEAAGPLHLVYLGRIDAHKEVPIALQGLARLRERGVDARLDIVGEGAPAYLEKLRQLIQALGIADSVNFCGFLAGDAKLAALRQCDLLILPSRSENFSFAVAEGLSLGIPALVSSGVALADLVRKHDCGAVFPIGDADALATAVLPYADLTFRRAAGMRARACAQEELSLAKMGASLQQLYADAISRQPPASSSQ